MPFYLRFHAGPIGYSQRIGGSRKRRTPRTYTPPPVTYTPRPYRAKRVVPDTEPQLDTRPVKPARPDRFTPWQRWLVALVLFIGYIPTAVMAATYSGFLLVPLVAAIVFAAVGTRRKHRQQAVSQQAPDTAKPQQPEPQARYSNRR